jgi:probable rRNA maturation factor
MEKLPPIEVCNGQRKIPVSVPSLNAFAKIALSLAWPRRRRGAEIASVSSVLVSIVGDKRMAQLHKEFCGIPGPTDVLTFQHGEIIISAQTARRQARNFRSSLNQELRLYLLHGLLHLCGYDDQAHLHRVTMERIQQELLTVAGTRLGDRSPRQVG